MPIRWTQDEEKELIKDVKNKIPFSKLTEKYKRSETAIILRFRKIIYDLDRKSVV